jgi:hypothetical protein
MFQMHLSRYGIGILSLVILLLTGGLLMGTLSTRAASVARVPATCSVPIAGEADAQAASASNPCGDPTEPPKPRPTRTPTPTATPTRTPWPTFVPS